MSASGATRLPAARPSTRAAPRSVESETLNLGAALNRLDGAMARLATSLERLEARLQEGEPRSPRFEGQDA